MVFLEIRVLFGTVPLAQLSRTNNPYPKLGHHSILAPTQSVTLDPIHPFFVPNMGPTPLPWRPP